MKLISLWEPWATLMALGDKRVETRNWRTSYRGCLAIHASKGGLTKRELAETLGNPFFKQALEGESLHQGHIIAVVNLVDCCPTPHDVPNPVIKAPSIFAKYPCLDTAVERAFGDYTPGRWAWVTADLFRLPRPIPFKARQGMFDVPPDVLERIREQRQGRAV